MREESHFRVLRALEENPHLSQREIAETLGVSVAKVNYLINALVEKGHIKIAAFRRSGDKLNKIAYLLTPEGLANRIALTRDYLEKKTREYEAIKAEIKSLRAELATKSSGQVDSKEIGVPYEPQSLGPAGCIEGGTPI